MQMKLETDETVVQVEISNAKADYESSLILTTTKVHS